MLANHGGQFKTIQLRHAHVHQHHRDVGVEQNFKRLLGGIGLDQVLAKFAEHDLIAQQLGRLIVDHENVHLFACTHRFSVPISRACCGGRDHHRCSHIRSDESNCSVLTGLARYSDAPASRHFSRSPFMAFAVRAMMGKRWNDTF